MNRTARFTVLGLMTVAVVVVATLALSPSVRARGLGAPSFTVNCDDGDSIQAVLDRVKDGVDIEVWGTCDESVSIDKDRIRLIGKDGATLSAPAGRGHVIAVTGSRAEIHDFEINAGGIPTGIAVYGGSATIVNNNIRNSIFSAIQVQDNGSATIRDSQLTDNTKHAVLLLMGSRALIERATVDNAGSAAIYLNGSTATINDSEIKNSVAGISVRQSASADSSNNRIKNNTYEGIAVMEASAAEIGGNTITGNGSTGVSVDHNSSLNLVDWFGPDTIEGNGWFGVRCGFSGNLRVWTVPDFGTGNPPSGNAFVDPACHFENNSGQPFP
jgi:parallel beta-helix repeat protein